MLIVIDPGHGGQNPGAVHGGVMEKDINLSLSLMVAEKLRKNFEVFLVREEDKNVSLEERVKVANERKAALFLSLHSNAGGGHGFESFIHPVTPKKTQEIRKDIHETIMNTLQNYAIRDRGKKTANFYVLRETKCPAVLLESLFLDNERERKLLSDKNFLLDLSKAIAAGVEKALPPTSASPKKRIIHTVQIGAFFEKKGAETYMAKAREKGFKDAFVLSREVAAGKK